MLSVKAGFFIFLSVAWFTTTAFGQDVLQKDKITALKGLDEVAIVVRPGGQLEILGIKEFSDLMVIGLKQKVPALRVKRGAQSWLELSYIATPQVGSITLSLYRWARIVDTGESIFTTVWSDQRLIGRQRSQLRNALGVGQLKLFDPETSHQISLGRDVLIYSDETELKKQLRMGMGLIIYKKDFPRAKLSSFPEGSFLSLYGERRNIRARLWLDSDGVDLSLYDNKGNIRATLGRTSIETTRTGAVTKRAESSLVLFDKNGKVLWSAP